MNIKKQIHVITLIAFTAVVLVVARQFHKAQPAAEKVCMTAYSELIHDMIAKSLSISEKTKNFSNEEMDEDKFEMMLEWFQNWYGSMQDERLQEAVCYQMMVPCHFFLNVYPAKDPLNTYDYRNIDEILWSEEGRINTMPAYLADVIIDTYIREYGGEDTQYHIELGIESWKEPELRWSDIDFMKIYNDSVTLNVIWDGYMKGAISVYIEDRDGAEVQYKRMIKYAYHMETEGYTDYCHKSNYWDCAYCMFVDPEPEQKEYHYRNVQPTDTVSEEEAHICDAYGYAVADRAIDKYIRDWDGSDIHYDVKLISKVEDEEKGTFFYTLSVMDQDEEVLQIEYTEKEWLVMVSICNS